MKHLYTFKNPILVSIGVLVFIVMLYSMRQYMVRNRAAGNPAANMTIQPASVTVNMGQDSNFNFTFNINGQKVTAAEMYVDFDPMYVEYYKEYSTGSGFSEIKDPGKENYFDVPLLEEVASPDSTTKRLRIVLVSKFNDPANPNWTTNVTGNLKFRAKQSGTSAITINKTLTLLAGVTGTGEPTYFDLPTTDIKATLTISGTGGTVTPTAGALTPTTGSTATPTMTAPTATRTPTIPPGNATSTPMITGTPTVSPTSGNQACNDNDDHDDDTDDDGKKDNDDDDDDNDGKNDNDDNDDDGNGKNDDDDNVSAHSLAINAFGQSAQSTYDVVLIPDGYTSEQQFQQDVKVVINQFKSMKLGKNINKKVNFISTKGLAKGNDIKQCDPVNGVKHPCWSKAKAKDVQHACQADAYMILAYTPTIQENAAQTQEVYNYWGQTSGATWGLGSGESLIFRYNLSAGKVALTRAVAGMVNNATVQSWERALRKF